MYSSISIERMNFYMESMRRKNVVLFIVLQVECPFSRFLLLLLRCCLGVSRSATIVLAYLMKYHHRTLKEAFEYLIEKRPQIWPNEGFLLQLIRYETELMRAREITTTTTTDNQSQPKEDNPIETLNEFEHKHAKDE